jgi:hypothetical protein
MGLQVQAGERDVRQPLLAAARSTDRSGTWSKPMILRGEHTPQGAETWQVV